LSRIYNLLYLGVLTAASAAIPAGLTYKYDWGASPTFNDNDTYMIDNYVKPWCRFSPYIVGILLGYFLHITKGKPFKMSKVTNLWGWVIAIATGLAIVYGLNIPDHINGESLTGLSMVWLVTCFSRIPNLRIHDFFSKKGPGHLGPR
jgi:hypothetical protein